MGKREEPVAATKGDRHFFLLQLMCEELLLPPPLASQLPLISLSFFFSASFSKLLSLGRYAITKFKGKILVNIIAGNQLGDRGALSARCKWTYEAPSDRSSEGASAIYLSRKVSRTLRVLESSSVVFDQ